MTQITVQPGCGLLARALTAVSECKKQVIEEVWYGLVGLKYFRSLWRRKSPPAPPRWPRERKVPKGFPSVEVGVLDNSVECPYCKEEFFFAFAGGVECPKCKRRFTIVMKEEGMGQVVRLHVVSAVRDAAGVACPHCKTLTPVVGEGGQSCENCSKTFKVVRNGDDSA